jgi:uncharacterized membrane protein
MNTTDTPARHDRVAIIRNRILAGILFATPVLATIWIFNFFLNLATGWFPKALVPHLSEVANGYLLKLIVLLCILIVFYLLGVLTFLIGKRMGKFVDELFMTIPVVNSIYGFIKSFTNWIENRQSTLFHSVVLVEYPKKGVYALGLMTAETPSIISNSILDEAGKPLECVNVFIATTPNPTSGFFLIYPKRDVIFLKMDVAAAMNLVITAGAILPNSKAADLQKPAAS